MMGMQGSWKNVINWIAKQLRKKSLSRHMMMWRRDEQRKMSRVPRGCFPVYVGEEHKRYVIPLERLSSIRFQALLDEYKDEIQHKESKAITLPCSILAFETVLSLVKAEKHHSL